jgi:hypothetical protein
MVHAVHIVAGKDGERWATFMSLKITGVTFA